MSGQGMFSRWPYTSATNKNQFSKPFEVSDYKDVAMRRVKSVQKDDFKPNTAFQTRSISMSDREEIRRRLAMEPDNEETQPTNCDRRTRTSNANARRASISHELSERFEDEMNIVDVYYQNDPQRQSRQLPNVKTVHRNSSIDDNKVLNRRSFHFMPNRNDEVRISTQLTQKKSVLKKTLPSPNNNSTAFPISEAAVMNLNSGTGKNFHGKSVQFDLRRMSEPRALKPPSSSQATLLMNLSSIPKPSSVDKFRSYHCRLYSKTKFALSQSGTMAKVEMAAERRERSSRRSWPEVAKLLSLPVTWRGDGTLHKVQLSVLNSMSYAQLQILVNDLLTQIERLNEGLVKQLVMRDDLTMERDSVLVDIGDLNTFLRRSKT